MKFDAVLTCRNADQHHSSGIDDCCLLSIYKGFPSAVIRDGKIDKLIIGVIALTDKAARGSLKIFHGAAGIVRDAFRRNILQFIVGQSNFLARTALG